MYKLNPEKITRAEIVVGIPSYNEADNIAYVVKQAATGLRNYLPDFISVIINVDNNSPDDTKTAFMNAERGIPKIYISTPPGVKGKGNNLYNLLTEMVRLNARAAVVVDADLTSITPEWVRDLATPILNGYDYATPIYCRNEYDGTITNNICYPLIYGLLGTEIRQPIGGDFSFSRGFAKHLLNQIWTKTTKQYGIDIFMTLNAILGGFECCQVGLGAKVHKPSAPKLGPMFSQVVGTLFATLLTHKDKWLGSISPRKPSVFGNTKLETPQSLSIDYKGMKASALYQFKINRNILENALGPVVFDKLSQMYKEGKINIGADLWTKIVYNLLYAYDTTDMNSHLIEAMKSLYFGRVMTFIRQTLDKGHQESEQMIQNQAKHFFRLRTLITKNYEYKRAIA